MDGTYAWDVWMAYKPGVRWEGEYPPTPDHAMHQLGSGQVNEVMPRLDSRVFAEVVNRYLKELGDST
jgi:hypothetical protein